MRRDRLLLAEIIAAGERITALVAGLEATNLEVDLDKRDALLWNFTVLGEAVGQLSDEVTSVRSEIAWSAPIRMRNRIVHGYWSIDLDVLLATARDDLETFLAGVRIALAQMPPTE